jgi:hypothetical protein
MQRSGSPKFGRMIEMGADNESGRLVEEPPRARNESALFVTAISPTPGQDHVLPMETCSYKIDYM